MSFFRILGLICIAWLMTTMSAWAQTSDLETVPATTEASTPSVDTKTTNQKVLEPKSAGEIDFDDPAVIAAIEARDAAEKAKEDADKALAEAVREQMELSSAAEAGETGQKPSIIPSNAEEVKALFGKIGNKLMGWLTSLKFLAQIGAIILAYILAPLIARMLRKRIFLFRDKPAEDVKLKVVRDYLYRSNKLLRPIVLVGLLILFGVILKAVPAAGDTWLVKIAQSLAVVFLLYKAIKEFITNDLFQKLAVWTVIPLALIMLFGYYDDLLGTLNGVELLQMGGTPITLMTVVLLLIFGALFFKIGNIANSKGQNAIRSQEGLDIATQEVVGKLFQIALFTVIFILVMGAAKVPLSGLVVIFSALSLGVGLGLQPVAANFVSGMIILFDRRKVL